MFVLRRVHSKEPVWNELLGSNYISVLDWREEERFNQICLETWLNKKDIPKTVYGFILCDNGNVKIPLYKKSYYYIMTSEGTTFEKIEYRNE